MIPACINWLVKTGIQLVKLDGSNRTGIKAYWMIKASGLVAVISCKKSQRLAVMIINTQRGNLPAGWLSDKGSMKSYYLV